LSGSVASGRRQKKFPSSDNARKAVKVHAATEQDCATPVPPEAGRNATGGKK